MQECVFDSHWETDGVCCFNNMQLKVSKVSRELGSSTTPSNRSRQVGLGNQIVGLLPPMIGMQRDLCVVRFVRAHFNVD